MKIQKWFLFVVFLISAASAFFGHKYLGFSAPALMTLTGFTGASLMGLAIVNHVKYQTSVIKPYIDVGAINERINELKT